MNANQDGSSTLIMISQEGMGHGENELRRKVLATYLGLLDESGMLPGAIGLLTEGVKLAVRGSQVVDTLRSLESRGVRVILCKNCLDHFGLTDKIAVGVIGGMTDIIAAQWAAEKIVTI